MTRETSCGMCGIHPRFLQKFATSRSYMIVYSLLGTVQAMAYVYFIISLTTMEKRFKIHSRTTGIMLSGNEISQILFSLFLSYFGGQRNRPRWIAWGVFISGLSCFILALPHFLYGAGEDALALTKEYADKLLNSSTSESISAKNMLCSPLKHVDQCEEIPLFSEYSLLPAILVFISQFVLGIGNTLYYSLGNTYMDDNTKKTNTPMFLGYAMALRTFGPAVGFFLGPLCLSIFIDPSLTPLITKSDPRWMGAWWLGWIILGIVMFLFTFLVGLFPKKLPTPIPKADKDLPQYPKYTPKITMDTKSDELALAKTQCVSEENPQPAVTESITKDEEIPTLKDFPIALRRVLKNKLLMANILSTVFYIFGSSGYITFMAKYMEIQYNKPSATSTIVAGPAILIGAVSGFLISGWFISKKKPSPRKLLLWNVVIGCVVLMAQISYIFIKCPQTQIEIQTIQNERPELINTCNNDCMCSEIKYNPICHKPTGEIYFSACHAGCKEQSPHDQIYTNCSCIAPNPSKVLLNNDSASELASNIVKSKNWLEDWNTLHAGPCLVDCSYGFTLFIVISCVVHFLGATGKIGNILVNYRCVETRDKAFAQGLLLLMVSLCALTPGPIIYGILFDSTCVEWGEKCGKQTNCLMYDKDKLRLLMNGSAFGFTIIAVILDGVVCYLGKNINLYDEENSESKPNKPEEAINKN